ncbi:hypothetical protein [Rhodococcus sp. 11-3]|uniref:hypothetical protein n=1 Tax=Rhodococcus sp. 11-3 TaxID=2854796 RepID=UPI00203B9335|nr:hypothetical protein [Rhodococcus sp. 11-3]USC16972.1 hypothetical protein KZJ41_08955 [Rhodococcus sp. 11-3]
MDGQEFDADRDTRVVSELQGSRHIVARLGSVTLRVDELGAHINLPVRIVDTELLGSALELGPYSLSVHDAVLLKSLLAEYLTRVEPPRDRDFRP